MKTKRILLLIPFVIAIATIARCWIEIATSNINAQWRHYSAIVFVLVVVYFCFKSFTHAMISIGAFFVVGTLNGFSMTSGVETSRTTIAGLTTPPYNVLSLGLLFLYLVLNIVTILELQADQKERRIAIRNQKLNSTADRE